MSKKMNIRNCPALYQIIGMTNECLGTDYQCQDRTDCLIKQVIEKCKEAYLRPEELDEIKNRTEYLCKCSHHNMAASILQLFEIEEVE